jgi:hypothetical protein
MATPTDHSGSLAVGGAAQTIMPANNYRSYWRLQNQSQAEIWWNDIGPAVVGQPGSYRLGPGAMRETPVGGAGIFPLSAVSATSGVQFSAMDLTASVQGIVITDRSGIVSLTAIVAFPVNANRNGWRFQNLTSSEMWYSYTGTAVVGAAGSFRIGPGEYLESSPGEQLYSAILLIGVASTLNFSAGEW